VAFLPAPSLPPLLGGAPFSGPSLPCQHSNSLCRTPTPPFSPLTQDLAVLRLLYLSFALSASLLPSLRLRYFPPSDTFAIQCEEVPRATDSNMLPSFFLAECGEPVRVLFPLPLAERGRRFSSSRVPELCPYPSFLPVGGPEKRLLFLGSAQTGLKCVNDPLPKETLTFFPTANFPPSEN